MSEFTNYLEAALVDHTFRNSAYTSPTTVYAALFTAISDGDAGSVTEVSGGSYARVAITFGAGSQVTGAYEISNSADVDFPTATANWGTITHFGVYDASSSGNLLAHSPLDSSQVVNDGGTPSFPTGTLKVRLD